VKDLQLNMVKIKKNIIDACRKVGKPVAAATE
jgi:pyruvate kinase